VGVVGWREGGNGPAKVFWVDAHRFHRVTLA
jgi:hypothetical protein